MPCPVVRLDNLSADPFFNTRDSASAPIDRPEPLAPEEGVENADRSPGLRAVAEIGIKRIAAVAQVAERDAVLSNQASDSPRDALPNRWPVLRTTLADRLRPADRRARRKPP
jgi:hypothetical protein